MAGKWHFVVLLFLLIGCASFNKNSTSSTTTNVDFLTQTERPDWKQMIDSGEIGYFNPSTNTLIGLDEPPHNKGEEGLQPVVEFSKRCEDYVEENRKEVAELEFVVGKNGELRQFFVLESAGPCDEDVAAGLKQAKLLPAQEDEQNKAALVHLRIYIN